MNNGERLEYFFWGALLSGITYVTVRVFGMEDAAALAAVNAVAVVVEKFHTLGVVLLAVAVSSAPFLPGIVKMIMAPLVDRFNQRLSPEYERELNREAKRVMNSEQEKYREQIHIFGQQDRDRRMVHTHKLEEVERRKVALEKMAERLAETCRKYDEVTEKVLTQAAAMPAGTPKANHAARITKLKVSAMDEMNQALCDAKGIIAGTV